LFIHATGGLTTFGDGPDDERLPRRVPPTLKIPGMLVM